MISNKLPPFLKMTIQNMPRCYRLIGDARISHKTCKCVKSLIIIFIVFFKSLILFGQKQYTVKISFPSNINVTKINININDGIGSKPISVQKHYIIYKGSFLQKYALLTVSYKGQKSYENQFWLNGKAASINFISKDTNQNFLEIHKLTNALDLLNNGKKSFNKYVEFESNQLDSFLKKAGNDRSDSLTKIFFELTERLTNKTISFIEKNPNLYYSLHRFRYNLSNFAYVSPDSLKLNFYKIFPENIQKSFEGEEILKILNGRILNKGNPVPKFVAKDTNFKTFNSEKFNDKFYIIIFWASWCKPCLEEIPLFKEISNKYSKEKVELLFVNTDDSIEKFDKSKTKYLKEWSQIHGDNNIIKAFGISSLPQVFLIDKSGIIIYSRDKENDNHLEILNQILSTKIL